MQLQNFTLEHVDGGPISLSEFLGRPMVLVIADKGTGPQAAEISKTVGSQLKETVTVVSVMHLTDAPKLARPLVKRDLKKVYDQALSEASADRQARGLPLGDPTRAVVMLADWDGVVAKTLGVDPSTQAVAILVGPDGSIQGQVSGAGAGQQIVSHLSAQ